MLRLKPTARRLIVAGFAASCVFSFSAPGYSGVIGSSILEILNFQIRDAGGGAQLTLGGDISVIAGNNSGDLSVGLGAANDSTSAAAPVALAPAFGAIDLAQLCLGTGCSPFPENSYSGFGQTPPPTSTYALADMVLTGSALDATANGGPAGGTNARSRAGVSIEGGTNNGSSTSTTGSDVNVQLVSSVDRDIEFSLDYILNMLAFVDSSMPGTTGSSQAGASWSLSLFQLTNPANQLSWSPSEINRTINLSVDANVPVSDSGSLVSNTFTMLAGQQYQFGVSHSTRSEASFLVPEPGVIAIFGMGLLAIGLASTRRSRSA
ncbi:MAG: EDSAP-1 family PEP-CTERM protein [Rhodospirillaceae bacterium]